MEQQIVNRLMQESERMKRQFATPGIIRTRHTWIDNLLPEDLARAIAAGFPPPGSMRYMSNFRERKYTTKAMDNAAPMVRQSIFAFQAPSVIRAVEHITGLTTQKPDPHLYAGGLSAMACGHFLHPHIDNSHDMQRRHYRTLNLLYYVTPDWKVENGGNLELWDESVQAKTVVPSLFNRLVIMETNRYSWHGVSRVEPRDGLRLCVSNYYFSENSPDGQDYFHITAFSAPPERPLVRAISLIDNLARSAVRKIVPNGLSRKDIYRAKP